MAEVPITSSFDECMERILLVTGTRTQLELAQFLGLRQSSISDAKRRSNIPSDWLLVLLRLKNVHPEWILTGKEPCYLPLGNGSNTAMEQALNGKNDENMLHGLPSRMLADELLRRIAVLQRNIGEILLKDIKE